MIYLLIYLGIGVAVYFAFFRLYRKTGVDTRVLNIFHEPLAMVFAWLFWPLYALICIVWWLADYLRITSKRKAAKERTEALKQDQRFSHLSPKELLAAQARALDELDQPDRKV